MTPHFTLKVGIPNGAPIRALTAQWAQGKILSVHYILTHDLKNPDGVHPQNEVICKLESRLETYLSCKPEELAANPVSFDDLWEEHCHPGRASKYSLEVWDSVRKIRCGQIHSYGELGNAPKVGEACGENLFAIVVPCFRVVKARHLLGDFHRGHASPMDKKTARKIKRWLLMREGWKISGPGRYCKVRPGK